MKVPPPPPTIPPIPDVDIMAMRNAIYQTECRDWDNIVENWRKDEAWLVEQYNKLKAVEKHVA